ncbi:hypothetical protein VB740_04720 [Nostoc sp. UHCC 0251]|nr:hypothetical protein [Nostoc sp. UHCC 0251]MEA5622262.1 hypothetical protein [Nostoc sp. UHCC 0251]
MRSLKDVSTEQALTMLNNILRSKWQDNQLVDSGLTREEMSKIAQIFVDVWQQFHHKRIAYPKLLVIVNPPNPDMCIKYNHCKNSQSDKATGSVGSS